MQHCVPSCAAPCTQCPRVQACTARATHGLAGAARVGGAGALAIQRRRAAAAVALGGAEAALGGAARGAAQRGAGQGAGTRSASWGRRGQRGSSHCLAACMAGAAPPCPPRQLTFSGTVFPPWRRRRSESTGSSSWRAPRRCTHTGRCRRTAGRGRGRAGPVAGTHRRATLTGPAAAAPPPQASRSCSAQAAAHGLAGALLRQKVVLAAEQGLAAAAAVGSRLALLIPLGAAAATAGVVIGVQGVATWPGGTLACGSMQAHQPGAAGRPRTGTGRGRRPCTARCCCSTLCWPCSRSFGLQRTAGAWQRSRVKQGSQPVGSTAQSRAAHEMPSGGSRAPPSCRRRPHLSHWPSGTPCPRRSSRPRSGSPTCLRRCTAGRGAGGAALRQPSRVTLGGRRTKLRAAAAPLLQPRRPPPVCRCRRHPWCYSSGTHPSRSSRPWPRSQTWRAGCTAAGGGAGGGSEQSVLSLQCRGGCCARAGVACAAGGLTRSQVPTGAASVSLMHLLPPQQLAELRQPYMVSATHCSKQGGCFAARCITRGHTPAKGDTGRQWMTHHGGRPACGPRGSPRGRSPAPLSRCSSGTGWGCSSRLGQRSQTCPPTRTAGRPGGRRNRDAPRA